MSKPPQRRFAEGTAVPSAKSRGEMDALLERHGATQRAIGEDEDQGRAVVVFRMQGRNVRLSFKFLPPTEPKQEDRPRGYGGWATPRRVQWQKDQAEQHKREAWRRLLLVTKAKLELVADGGSTVEREFLADIMLPNGQTVHEAFERPLAQSYLDGLMPPLLPGA